MGMVCTTDEDPPPVESVHCVPRRWVVPARKPPAPLWDDAGTAGRLGSIWTVNELGSIMATTGHAPPKEEFFDLREPRFFLDPGDMHMASTDAEFAADGVTLGASDI